MAELLRPKEVADTLGLSTETVYRMVAGPDPVLSSVRVGAKGRSIRVLKAALEAWIAGQRPANPGVNAGHGEEAGNAN